MKRERKEYAHQWYLANKERTRERRKQYSIKWRAEHPDRVDDQQARFREKVRQEVYGYYSQGTFSCARCGIKDRDVLCIDHINNGGKQHVKVIGRFGTNFYRWLRQQGFPPGYQVLCWNCNHKKELERERSEKH